TRALAQLKSWLALKPQAQPTVTLLEQSIQGEQQRDAVFAGSARPQMPDSQWPWLSALASALCSDSETAQRQRLAAFEQAPLNPGNLNQTDTP
ncbi:protein of avirulence locus ImpE, partial [Enterobacter kobei]|nr:protein of avirulence locus ImpE [Enterobacter kobei]